MSSVELGRRELFGGAITMTLPTSYTDASDLRQIPNNQEVFLSQNSDTSLVIEVLGLVEEGLAKDDLWQAANISHDNSSLSSTIDSEPNNIPSHTSTEPKTPKPTILSGRQKIHKFSHDPHGGPRAGQEHEMADDVYILIALWRIDLDLNGKRKKADVVCSVNINLSSADGRGEEEKRVVEKWWRDSMEGFRILDFDLFGDEE